MKSILFLAAGAMIVSSASIAAEPKKTQHGGHGSQGQQMNMPAKAMDHGKSHNKGMVMPAAKRIDTSTTKMSDARHFKVSIASQPKSVAINIMHAWELTHRDHAGKPIDNAKIRIGGGMPDHGHGLPTAPNVNKNLGGGKYLVEGMKFNMAGWWQVRFDIHAQHHKDKVAFNLVVN